MSEQQNYTVYRIDSGEVMHSIGCNERDLVLGPGEGVIAGVFQASQYKVVDGVAVRHKEDGSMRREFILQHISRLEAMQARAVREAALGKAGARERLEAMDAQIRALADEMAAL